MRRSDLARRSGVRSRKLDPRDVAHNPVMFVVEVGSVITTIAFIAAVASVTRRDRPSSAGSASGSGSPCCSPTSPRPWPRAAARPRPTRCAGRKHRDAAPTSRSTARSSRCAATELRKGDVVVVVGRRDHPRRRRRHRGHRLGRRVGHHRRVGAGHPRERRRPQRRHRRHPRALRPDQGADHLRSGRDASSTA